MGLQAALEVSLRHHLPTAPGALLPDQVGVAELGLEQREPVPPPLDRVNEAYAARSVLVPGPTWIRGIPPGGVAFCLLRRIPANGERSTQQPESQVRGDAGEPQRAPGP